MSNHSRTSDQTAGRECGGQGSQVPKRLGNWYADAGFQYYHLVNDSLLLAQTVTGTASTFATAHCDIVVAFGGVGFGF
jgi:hypothetical protein